MKHENVFHSLVNALAEVLPPKTKGKATEAAAVAIRNLRTSEALKAVRVVTGRVPRTAKAPIQHALALLSAIRAQRIESRRVVDRYDVPLLTRLPALREQSEREYTAWIWACSFDSDLE